MRGKTVGNYETLNELLVTLFRDVMDIEQKVIITPEFKDITNNDMHVIEAIGIGEPKNMSSIARELSVTVGTLTIAMSNFGIAVIEALCVSTTTVTDVGLAIISACSGVTNACFISLDSFSSRS